MTQPSFSAGAAGGLAAAGPGGHGSPGRWFGIVLWLGIGVWLVSGCQSTTPPATPTHTTVAPTVSAAATSSPAATATAVATGTATTTAATATAGASATPTTQATLRPPVWTATVAVSGPITAATALALANGPHLFIDDYLIAYRDQVTRQVVPPTRALPSPLITGLATAAGDANVNFATVVLRDPQSGQYRMWYTAYDANTRQAYSALITSPDGTHWLRPATPVSGTLNAPISEVLDLGPHYYNLAERFKAITSSTVKPVYLPSLLVSPDGNTWHRAQPDITSPVAYGEVWRVFQDLSTGGFGLLHRWNTPFDWTDAAGTGHHNTLHDPGLVRLFAHSNSPDLQQVTQTQVIFAPDRQDSGETQFYSMSNVIHRGDYYLAALDVLRDDLTASGVPTTITSTVFNQSFQVYGMGYTVLAWSRDGQHWFRDRETDPFLSPSPQPGAWDHAMAWVNSIVQTGDTIDMYYGGYQYGHKVFADRQIGLITTWRDRYVSQTAGARLGTLRTPLVTFQAAQMTLNATAGPNGQIRVEVLGANGQPLPGFGLNDCRPVTGNSFAAPVTCAGSFASLAHQPVYLQFELQNAQLFAFSLNNGSPA